MLASLGIHAVTPESEILIIVGLIILFNAWGAIVNNMIEKHRRANQW